MAPRLAACWWLLLAAAAAYGEATDGEAPRFWKTGREAPRGVAVVAHGLNVRPSKMGDPEADGTIVKLLLDAGFDVFRVTLAGHSGPIDGMKTVTAEAWLAGAYGQYCQAAAEAEKAGAPLYLVGFSLGALVYEALMSGAAFPGGSFGKAVRFEKAVLFAPALSIKPVSRTLTRLPFTSGGSIINSMSPVEYRAQRGASVAAYQAVFQLEDRLRGTAFAGCNIDTLVFIDPLDEFLSLSGLRQTITGCGLSRWRVVEVSTNGGSLRPRYHHLVIDSRCFTPAAWREIESALTGFL